MDVYIVDAIRTPRGRGNAKSSLKSLSAIQLVAQLFQALSKRHPLDTAIVQDVVLGCVTQHAEQAQNIGRLALLAAGWSDTTPAITINRYCASGLAATHLAALQAQYNDGIAVGGGVEVMSRVPMGADAGPVTHDPAFQAQNGLISLGLSADVVASVYGYTRAQCDVYAYQSQQRAAHARANGYFVSLVPVTAADGELVLQHDENIRPDTSLDELAKMPAAFADPGAPGLEDMLCQRFGLPALQHVHHTGNSPARADGASLVLLASAQALQRHGLKPRARIVAMADVGIDRTLALTGAVQATQKVLKKAGLTADQMDLFEVNEAFAAVMLQYMQQVPVDRDRLNVNGGAIALGHALGSTGSALVAMALDELERRRGRYALVAISGATGVATATIVERV